MTKIYKYTTEDENSIYVHFLKNLSFGYKTLNCEKGWCTIPKGYSWDGCSPKMVIFGKIIGTPDGGKNETKESSMWHDVFYQYKSDLSKLGVTRYEVDVFFLFLLTKKGWKYSNLYYYGVRLFGGLYGKWE